MHTKDTVERMLVDHVASAVAKYGHDRLELEWRLGHRQGAFRPGVGAEAWARLQRALDASPAFQRTHKETREQLGDSSGVRCVDGTVWMHKKRLADVDSETDKPWSVRASVSLEVTEAHPPKGVQLKYERRKQRWSYRHMCWSIDLTKVCSNLPGNLDDDQETYEVEVELVDPGMLFERTVENLVEWGWKIVGDVCDLMSAQ